MLTRSVYDKKIDESRARALVRELVRLPVRPVRASSLYPRAFNIARALRHKRAYDALYIAAAEQEDAELLTIDGGMHDGARRLGVRATLVR